MLWTNWIVWWFSKRWGESVYFWVKMGGNCWSSGWLFSTVGLLLDDFWNLGDFWITYGWLLGDFWMTFQMRGWLIALQPPGPLPTPPVVGPPLLFSSFPPTNYPPTNYQRVYLCHYFMGDFWVTFQILLRPIIPLLPTCLPCFCFINYPKLGFTNNINPSNYPPDYTNVFITDAMLLPYQLSKTCICHNMLLISTSFGYM